MVMDEVFGPCTLAQSYEWNDYWWETMRHDGCVEQGSPTEPLREPPLGYPGPILFNGFEDEDEEELDE